MKINGKEFDKCEKCFAYFLVGNAHKCDGLMKMIFARKAREQKERSDFYRGKTKKQWIA